MNATKLLVHDQTKKRICTIDTETNPFAHGETVAPFTLGFYDGEAYFDFWGDDCVDQFFKFLKEHYENEELLIYAHNGGGFDFFFFMKYLDEYAAPIIIRGKLVKLFFQGQEFRDSFKIIPSALSSYQKDEIDYNLFKKETRDYHKREILKYQKSDCIYLYELVIEYHRTFGDALTIGGTSIKVLSEFHEWEKINQDRDRFIRPYYAGGRNQCFESGELRGQFKVYDVNSMYPHVMRNFMHPVGKNFNRHKRIREGRTCFVTWEGENFGAVPVRHPNGSLSFTQRTGQFNCSIHEFEAGLETGTIKVKRILYTIECDEFTNFAEFVDTFYNLRLKAKADGDKIFDLFYKLLLNNSYGKFAQDPSTYKDYVFTFGEPPKGDLWSTDKPNGWMIDSSYDVGEYTVIIWARPSPEVWGYKNVATAASITGASRAELLRGISRATRPIYCDTDSIICEDFAGDTDNKRLGAWKLEATGDRLAIGGKKLYALFNGEQCVKMASKGVRISPADVINIANGGSVEYANPVPKFNMDGSQTFKGRVRNIRSTA